MRRTTTTGILSWAVVVALLGGSLQAQLVQTPTFLVVSARNNSAHYILWPDVAVGNDGTIAAAGFNSRNAKSPARCTALITCTADGTPGLTDHLTKLLIEVTDHNDF